MSYFSGENKVQVGIGLGLNRMPVSNLVRSIFSNGGYDGFILDAEDIFTLNQVSTGTTPVTAVNDPIGLMLDKHLGQLGPELHTDSFVTFVGESSRVSAGVYRLYSSAGAYSLVNIAPVVSGKTYKITFTVDSVTVSGTGISNEASTPTAVIASSVGVKTLIVTATGGTLGLKRATTAMDVQISNISVKLIDGNHAIQSTAAARPTWQVDANGHHYAQFLGTDDSLSCATGGGGSTGFLFCAALKPTGGAGTLRTLFSDVGTNTGYKVQLDTNNKLSFSAGDNAAFTTLASTATVDVGTTYLLTCWDDGTNLNVQINSAAAETVARPVVVGDGITYTLFKDDGAASSFAICDFYRGVYFKNSGLTAEQRASTQSFVKAGAGL